MWSNRRQMGRGNLYWMTTRTSSTTLTTRVRRTPCTAVMRTSAGCTGSLPSPRSSNNRMRQTTSTYPLRKVRQSVDSQSMLFREILYLLYFVSYISRIYLFFLSFIKFASKLFYFIFILSYSPNQSIKLSLLCFKNFRPSVLQF